MAQEWYKVDNVAKVFLATNTRRDPRVFRISCTLQEQIDPELLNEALRVTAPEWPQFQVTLHRGLFWHYFESTDQLPTCHPEDKAPCAPLYVPERRNRLIYRVTYFGSRINLEMFHALTDGNGGIVSATFTVLPSGRARPPNCPMPTTCGASACRMTSCSFLRDI